MLALIFFSTVLAGFLFHLFSYLFEKEEIPPDYCTLSEYCALVCAPVPAPFKPRTPLRYPSRREVFRWLPADLRLLLVRRSRRLAKLEKSFPYRFTSINFALEVLSMRALLSFDELTYRLTPMLSPPCVHVELSIGSRQDVTYRESTVVFSIQSELSLKDIVLEICNSFLARPGNTVNQLCTSDFAMTSVDVLKQFPLKIHRCHYKMGFLAHRVVSGALELQTDVMYVCSDFSIGLIRLLVETIKKTQRNIGSKFSLPCKMKASTVFLSISYQLRALRPKQGELRQTSKKWGVQRTNPCIFFPMEHADVLVIGETDVAARRETIVLKVVEKGSIGLSKPKSWSRVFREGFEEVIWSLVE